ncbi:MAG: hypothetical protein ABIG29_02820 [Candidatus Nealsonbacteria bacterium]
MTKKILASVLIFVGLAVIFYGLYSSFNIFTGKEMAPEIFQTPAETKITDSQDVQVQMQKIIQDQLKGLVPTGSPAAFLNMISWSILAGILILGGAQIAGLGIKLLN